MPESIKLAYCTVTKQRSNLIQLKCVKLHHFKSHFIPLKSASSPHLDSSATGLHFPSWSSESQAQSFPPSHV